MAQMIRFPKRPRSKSIDLEDGDFVEVMRRSEPDDLDLADTGVVTPKPNSAAPLPRFEEPKFEEPRFEEPKLGAPRFGEAKLREGAGSSLAPMAMSARQETFQIPRVERYKESRISAIFAAAGHRPSLPWAAALLALGAIGAAGSMRLLDALDDRSHSEPPAAAAALPPALAPIAPPVTPAAKAAAPAPVVLKFGSSDAVTVALDAPKPAPPPIAAAPIAPAAPVVVASAPKPPAPVVAAAPVPPPPAPAPVDSVKRAPTVDSLAEQQLKAALK
jgi:hypothetical protein